VTLRALTVHQSRAIAACFVAPTRYRAATILCLSKKIWAARKCSLFRSAFGATVIGALKAVLADQLYVVDGRPPEPGLDYQQKLLAVACLR
jgi:hypothetical protein